MANTDHTLTTLFYAMADSDDPPILELLDINQKPVGALYLSKIKYKNFMVSETNNTERYYLYADGIGIYFSFYRKINL